MDRDELLRRYEAGERDFAGFDLRGINLCGSSINEYNLSGIDLSGAKLTGVIQAENLEEAQKIVNSSSRVRDGMLANDARIVEWKVHIGRDRFR